MTKYKRRFGDRKDARRVRTITAMSQINADLKPHRSVSDVFINQKMDLTALVDYVDKKKAEGQKMTYFHAILTAIGKVYYNRPILNYFIANRHTYEHNEVAISFVAKISFDDKSEEMMIIVPIKEDDNLETISKKIYDKVEAIRNNAEDEKDGANGAIEVLAKLPNILRVPLIGFMKYLDKIGHLPNSLIEDNLYYSSLIVSNLGTLKCGAILHNINDFGTCSALATIGEIRPEVIIDEKGNRKTRKMCEFGINLDERIGDGYYFIKSMQLLQYIFNNPELLEDNANEKIEISEIR